MIRETNEALSNKINALRFIAILGVLYIHAENYAQFGFLENTRGYFIEYKAILSFAWVVPLFFLLSSYLFFRGFSFRSLLEKWSRRIHTLLIPYLLWSTIYFTLFALLPRLGFLAPFINSTPAPLTIVDAFSSVLLHRYAGFLWFVKTLILLTVFAPVFYTLLSRKIFGELTLAVLLACMLVRPFSFPDVLSLDWRTLFFYACGAYVAIRFPDSARYTLPRGIRIALLCAIPAIILLNVIYGSELYSIAMIFCVWFGLDASVFRARRAYETTFFLYLTHILLFSLIKKVQFALLPHTEGMMLAAYASAPLIATAILVPTALLFKRLAPKVYAFFTGGR